MMQAARAPATAGRITALLCLAEVLTMFGYATYPTLLTPLQREWHLTNTESGLIGGAFFGGYMLAVPFLTTLTDRIDARRIYLLGCAMGMTGALGFAVCAEGFASAMLFQSLCGMGLAGTYMPGLKILSDRVHGPKQSRYVAFYTTSFTIGASVSFLLPMALVPNFGWSGAFFASAVGPVLAACLLLRVAGVPHQEAAAAGAGAPPHGALLDFRPVLRNRSAMGYILGYTAHCWELLGARSWLVAFVAFSASLHNGASVQSAAWIAAAINLLGLPASIYGNELAMRHGRTRVILLFMTLSGLMSAIVGFAASLPFGLVCALLGLHAMLVMGDSAALTAGTVAAASPNRRGTTLALHATLGFGAGLVAPAVFGLVLDLSGGGTRVAAWGWAYASQGVFCLLVPLAWAWLHRHR